jgi:hypothetical protein
VWFCGWEEGQGLRTLEIGSQPTGPDMLRASGIARRRTEKERAEA